jgi:hypothetical protein
MYDSLGMLLLGALLLLPVLAVAQPSVRIEKIAFQGWPNCYRMTNGDIELILTADVGPRIIRFGFAGEGNEFKEYADQMGKTGGSEWRIYGGHRLWHAPEAQPRSYAPDNSPIEVRIEGGWLHAIQPVEAATGIQKEMEIRMAGDAARVEVRHRLRNTNLWAVELAPWAMSVMAPGGRAIIPFPPRGAHPRDLDATNPLVMWPYTDFRDPRWTLGFKYISLRQDPEVATAQKAGVMAPDGWAAYARHGHLFIKKVDFDKKAAYPDFGCTVETFTNADMLELETLGPLVRIAPGAAAEHLERWSLFKNVPLDQAGDEAIDRLVLPRVRM